MTISNSKDASPPIFNLSSSSSASSAFLFALLISDIFSRVSISFGAKTSVSLPLDSTTLSLSEKSILNFSVLSITSGNLLLTDKGSLTSSIFSSFSFSSSSYWSFR